MWYKCHERFKIFHSLVVLWHKERWRCISRLTDKCSRICHNKTIPIKFESVEYMFIKWHLFKYLLCTPSSNIVKIFDEFQRTWEETSIKVKMVKLSRSWRHVGYVKECLHSFLTSALDRGEWSTSHPGPFGKNSVMHEIEGCMGPTARLGGFGEKALSPDRPAVCSRCTSS